jgi:non-ribosomal peptide synthetase component F
MDDSPKHSINLPPEQQAIRDQCRHPSGTLAEFLSEDVETSIAARFERIVRQYPDYTAIKSGNEVFTYAELNAMANREARAIAERTGHTAAPVALQIDKGVKQIAAMQGILKAAHPFVLMDSSLPEARLERILKDCAPELTVNERQYHSLADELMPATRPAFCFDSIDPSIPTDNLDTKIFLEDLACIVHTSGSTARPKGVIYSTRRGNRCL